MKKHLFVIVALALGLGVAACGDASNSNIANNPRANAANLADNTNTLPVSADTKMSTEAEFFEKAAVGGMSEVEKGKLAADKATTAELKKYGQMMVDDHTKANNELKALAAKKNVTLPTAPDADQKDKIADLGSKTGKDFDDEFIDQMIDDHEKTVALFETTAQGAGDSDIKAFAVKTLPTLKQHLAAIKTIEAARK